MPTDQKLDLDWGGWYSFYLMNWDDGINSSRTYRQYDTRVWGSASIDKGTHQVYSRLKLIFEDFNHGDSYDRDDDDTVSDVDRLYYQFDLKQALKTYACTKIDWNFKFKIGRDLVQLGTGYAFSQPIDAVQLTWDVANFEVLLLGAQSIRSYPDINQSRPDGGTNERNFWGGQITYNGIEKHQPYVYGIWNKDQKTDKWSLLQRFDYDSYYLGMGSIGEIVRNLRYGTELVYEGGSDYGFHDFLTKDHIEAWGYDANIEYLTQLKYSPRFGAEYMFASGDGNRLGSPTDTFGGNTNSKDTSFSGFGYRDTGLSAAPRLSNVNIWRLGGAFKPLEECEHLKTLEVGTDWFLYAKNRASGAISDPTADRQSSYLGWEMDYFLNWRITSDLAYTVRFGTFFPGAAYSDKTTRPFVLTGVTYSF